ncbi:unnamed protein product [Closterium sp. NIES-65]|nr:unnamed protein product [Closterium sp. NIES-65]
MAYDSTLLATANGTMGNTMVNYRTTLDNNNEIPLAYAPPCPTRCTPLSLSKHLSLGHPSTCTVPQPLTKEIPRPALPSPSSVNSPFSPRPPPPTSVYPYYVNLKLGSQKQVFSMALNLAVPDTSVPCDCLHCGSMPPSAHPPTHPRATFPGESEGDNRLAVWECGREIQSVFEGFSTTTSKPFTMLSSTTLKYISCSDQRCQTGMDTTGWAGPLDYYESDFDANSYLQSVGQVMEDTVYLTAPDGTEVNRSIILGMYQLGHLGMQGWMYGSWSAGGVLGLGWYSPFMQQLTGPNDPTTVALCLEATPTDETGWDDQMPLQTGSSHLTIGATGLPAGASYAKM